MSLTIDLTFLSEWGGQPPWVIMWSIFKHGGWVIFIFYLLGIIWNIILSNKRQKYLASIDYCLLAIDVPRDNEQGPKAAEQMFAQLAGARKSYDWIERNIKGFLPIPFSLELISIEGYVQFLIRTPRNLRDLVESAIYAQYPEAEITEVEDYTDAGPEKFPSEEYNLWGAELVLYNKDPYPIRTYSQFQDPLDKESFKDPMAALLEALSKIGEGEQIWLQLLITPTGSEWKKKGEELVKKLIGKKSKSKPSIFDRIFDLPIELMESLHNHIFGPFPPTKKESSSLISQMQFLSPGERKIVEAIQNKISKLGFKSKFRVIYLARKDVFSAARGVASVLGAIQQFNTLDMNGFKPHSKAKTSAPRFRGQKILAKKQTEILNQYRRRSNYTVASHFILNTEELATIYHFPLKTVKVPLLKKVEVKKAEAPVILPTIEEVRQPVIRIANYEPKEKNHKEEKENNKVKNNKVKNEAEIKENKKGGEPPPNLPVA